MMIRLLASRWGKGSEPMAMNAIMTRKVPILLVMTMLTPAALSMCGLVLRLWKIKTS